MVNILNWLFEYRIFIVIPIALITVVLFVFRIPNLPKGLKKKFATLLALLPVLALIALGFTFNYGYSHNPKELTISGKTLCFMNSRVITSRTGSSNELRLDIVDAETGKEIYRNYIGASGEILAEQNGELFYSAEENYYVIETSTGVVSKKYEFSTLPNQFSQLSSGVTSMEFQDESSGLLRLVAKNGDTYFIDPFSGKISDSTFEIPSNNLKRHHEFNYIKLSGDSGNSTKRIEFIGKNGSEGSLLTTSSGTNYQNQETGTTYLFPCFLCTSSKDQSAVIKSFSTTEKTSAVLTGVSMNMNQLWQINQKDLENGETENKLDQWTVYENNLIFNLDDTFYSINEKTGVVNWKVVL